MPILPSLKNDKDGIGYSENKRLVNFFLDQIYAEVSILTVSVMYKV